MKAKPILFSTPMVQALLDGRKTQTRRIVKPQPPEGMIIDDCCYSDSSYAFWKTDAKGSRDYCTCDGVKNVYGFFGEYLWVRETWCFIPDSFDGIGDCHYYKASQDESSLEYCKKYGIKWKPSIHMPRWASRLTLKIKDVRVEQLQEITGNDAAAEGVLLDGDQDPVDVSLIYAFRGLWDSINGKKHPWESNPWVWVIEFEVLRCNIDQIEGNT